MYGLYALTAVSGNSVACAASAIVCYSALTMLHSLHGYSLLQSPSAAALFAREQKAAPQQRIQSNGWVWEQLERF